MTSLLKRDFVNERAGSFYFLSDTLERASLPEQANAVKQSSSPASLICFSTRAPKPSRECSPHFPHAYISVSCRQEAGPLLLVRSGRSVPLSAAVRDVGSSPDPPRLPSVSAFERAEISVHISKRVSCIVSRELSICQYQAMLILKIRR